MELKGRSLSRGLNGYDVAELHKELVKLGYTIPPEESQKAIFGYKTLEAVQDFQRKYNMEETGIVDDEVARILGEKLPKTVDADEVKKIAFPLRLNMKGEKVENLHKALMHMGYAISSRDLEEKCFGATTRKAVEGFQYSNKIAVTGEMDKLTARKLYEIVLAGKSVPDTEKYRVRGSVHSELWDAKQGITVRLLERKLRGERKIEERKPRANGFFDIVYEPPMERGKVKENFQLVVKFIDEKENPVKIVDLNNPGKVAWVNLTEGEEPYKGKSEYDVLDGLLKKEFTKDFGYIKIEETSENRDISFLAARTGILTEDIMRLVLCYHLNAKADIVPLTQGLAIETRVFYAFLRQGLPAGLPEKLLDPEKKWTELIRDLTEFCLNGIILLDQAIQKSTLLSAVNNNYIPRRFEKEAEKIVEDLQKLRIKYTLYKKFLTGNVSLQEILSVSGMNTTNQCWRFTSLYIENHGTGKAFWEALKKDPLGFDVTLLKKIFDTAHITRNHIPTMSWLKDKASEARFLAKNTYSAWKQLIEANKKPGVEVCPKEIAGRSETERIEAYAKLLLSRAQEYFPTVAFASIVSKETVPCKDQIEKFIAMEPDFDLKSDYIDQYMSNNRSRPAIVELDSNKDLKNKVIQELKVMQRVLKLAPNVNAAKFLLENKLHSSMQIYFQGKDNFAAKYVGKDALTSEEAKAIFDRATQSYGMMLARIGQLRGEFQQLTPAAMLSKKEGMETAGQFADFPNLEVLFGSTDFCDCCHCRSVYSPAAYLADCLHFLSQKKAKSTDGRNKSAKDILFNRRPDIGEIELNCDNTNITLPYVDLVNEVLENLVAPPPAFVPPYVLNASLEADLNRGVVSDALAKAFQPPLSKNAVVHVREKGSWWAITEPAFTYTIKRIDESLQVISRSLQTTGTDKELGANPQYINSMAYEKLRRQIYPWSLPFDLWSEEASTYLGHLGAKRSELMETFSPLNKQTDILKDPDIAREYLGLTTLGWQIITGGFRVRVATVSSLSSLAGNMMIDTITTKPGDYVLVKNQSSLHENGIYVVQANAWRRLDYLTSAPSLIRVTDGKENKGTSWVVSPGSQGQAVIENVPAWKFWGLPKPEGSVSEWYGALAQVDVFIRQSGLDRGSEQKGEGFKNLLELVNTRFINPVDASGTPLLEISPINRFDLYATALNELSIKTTAATVEERERIFDRMHRFIRLSQVLRWSYRDLDLAVTVLQPQDLDDSFLLKLSHIKRIQSEIKLSLPMVLSFWGNISTNVYIDYGKDGQPETIPLYDQLFLNKAASNLVDGAFVLESGRKELLSALASGGPEKISGHKPVITAALGICDADLVLLMNRLSLPDRLDLAGLSSLYRNVILAKALKLSIGDYLSSRSLAGGNPFDKADTSLLLESIGRVRKVQKSGFTAEELKYLLKNEFSKESGISPSEETMRNVLEGIRLGLQKIALENKLTDEALNPGSDFLRKKLELLKWGGRVIDQWTAILNDTAVFEVELEALPEGLVLPNDTGIYEAELEKLSEDILFPANLKDCISYNSDSQKLRFTRAITEEEKKLLQGLSGDFAYQSAIEKIFIQPFLLKGKISYDEAAKVLRMEGVMTVLRLEGLLELKGDDRYWSAVKELFERPRAYILRNMKTFRMIEHKAPLKALPQEVKFDTPWSGKVYYDHTAKELCFNGPMTLTEKASLEALSVNAEYREAIQMLFDAVEKTETGDEGSFITTESISEMFDKAMTPRGRSKRILGEKLLPYLKKLLGESLVVQKLSETMKIPSAMMEDLLKGWILSPINPSSGRKCMDLFLASEFIESDCRVKLTAASFPAQFRAYNLLNKVTGIINRLKISQGKLSWIFERGPRAGWLDFNTLPSAFPNADNAEKAASFTAWEKLAGFLQLQGILGVGEAELEELFGIALSACSKFSDSEINEAKKVYMEALNKWTAWPLEDLETLLGGKTAYKETGLLNVRFPGEFTDGQVLYRLNTCFSILKRLGVSAAQCIDWSKPNVSAEDAASIKHAARAKYEEAQWLAIAKPLRDILREKQRGSMVAYLVSHPVNGASWNSPNDLFSDLLLDVEMSPLQMTSRIKQAISSVQLFVQRCLMNLEKSLIEPEPTEGWDQWKWMKNYRVWEANRKVFLYPENWIEPELRDDKTPFFEELENEILQNEINSDNVEDAFLRYLEKLDEVSKLDVCGIYDDKHDGVDILYVFARTKTEPASYYFRRYIDNSYWTAWEKVDLEISGDHLIPVVYNRKLFLFWPVFTERPMKNQYTPKVPSVDKVHASPEPSKYWELQLAWSVFKNGKWSPKMVSKRKLVMPWQRPLFSYNFRPRLKGFNLWIDVFITTSREFNNRKFYIPEKGIWSRLTSTDFDETACPWHSSSFVFNGDVIDIKMKDKNGSYSKNVHINFGEDGRLIHKLEYKDASKRLMLPPGMHFHASRLVNNEQNLVIGEMNVVIDNLMSDENGKFMRRMDSGRLLQSANAPFSLVVSQQDEQFDSDSRPFIYQDHQRAFFVKPQKEYRVGNAYSDHAVDSTSQYRTKYIFYPLYHPFTTLFVRELNRLGVEGLFNRVLQKAPHLIEGLYNSGSDNPVKLVQIDKGGEYTVHSTAGSVEYFEFTREYAPVGPNTAHESAEKEIVDFSFDGAYAQYNWELFFHAPLMIACRLSQNQRFEEAMRWFHYIFNPTSIENDISEPKRYWITKPFFDHLEEDYRNQKIETLLALINSKNPEYEKQVKAWRNNPFMPHLIARGRLVAYQRTVVMKYIDNLILWGDQLFRRDTIECINEATLLYVLAAEILGPRPQKLPPRKRVQDKTYNELEPELDGFGNAMVEVENTLPAASETGISSDEMPEQMPRIEMFYFGIPHNDKLLGYWDRVEDRLFKIRHSMNMDGKVRMLPLFEPPIDPALLVRAAAAGIDIGSVLNDINVSHPNYRFRIIVQKAQEFCNEVKALGSMLLSVLEKRDAEDLALLRSAQEIKLLQEMRELKKKQVKELEETLAGLEKSKEIIETRRDYYAGLEYMNIWEGISQGLSASSLLLNNSIMSGQNLAGILRLIPEFSFGTAGAGGTPTSTLSLLGSALQAITEANVQVLSTRASSLDKMASMSSTIGSYRRRKEEWDFQKAVADKEIQQMENQIEAAKIRIAIAEKELSNQELQIENAKTADEFMKSKFTNRQLYDWMVTQISNLYFESYQLAYDMAKRAEKCFRYELGIQNSDYIRFGYWDSLKKGLLSGEKLTYDLRRLEVAYMDQHSRELEITKHISLAQVSPLSVLLLKETGSCMVELPEWLFDMDYPGHYMRRIKSVSISIPCITGPYTSINCTLSLVKSSTRISSTLGDGYSRTGLEDARFTDQFGMIRSVATSNAQNDSGLFQLNFADDRYLPFEGAGLMSTWKIDMPLECNQIDFASISDIILHVQYTARDGGQLMQSAAKAAIGGILPFGGVRILNLRQEFPNEWYRFTNPGQQTEQTLTMKLEERHFPFYLRNKGDLVASRIEMIATSTLEAVNSIALTLPGQVSQEFRLEKDNLYGSALHDQKSFQNGSEPLVKGEWTFTMKCDNEEKAYTFEEAYLVVHYKLQ